jgi:TonB family protein
MRNRSAKLTIVLTTLLSLPFTLLSSAQQTAPSPAQTTQPDPVGPVKIGGPVKPPKVIYSVEPKYTDEARQKKFSGTVELYCWVDEEGKPSHIKVVRGVGMGLDEKAMDALRQYKFKPATRDGKPVKVDLYIDMMFQLF